MALGRLLQHNDLKEADHQDDRRQVPQSREYQTAERGEIGEHFGNGGWSLTQG
jgi:hypothetical protein